MAKTELKLSITIDLMQKYIKEGGGGYADNLKKIGIKFPDFTYKGSFETDDNELTEKKLVSELNRSARGIYAQFSMGVDSDVEDVLDKAKVNQKDKAAVAAGIVSGGDQIKKFLNKEVSAAHKKLTSLLEDILKQNSGKRSGEGVDFQSEAQVTKFLKAMEDIPALKKDYEKFTKALDAAAGAEPKDQPGMAATAYNTFIGSEGVHLVETARKIPKVAPVKPPDPKDATVAKQAEAVNEIAKLLEKLRPRMADLADEIDKLRSGYTKLQDVVAGHDQKELAGQAVMDKKQQRLVDAAFKSFPQLSIRTIDLVIDAVKDADKDLEAFKKANKK